MRFTSTETRRHLHRRQLHLVHGGRAEALRDVQLQGIGGERGGQVGGQRGILQRHDAQGG